MRYRCIALFIGVIILGAGSAVPVYALDPHKSINQYAHRIWLRQSGLPSNAVNCVVQTHDGYLWLGTPSGLFRFDGVEFRGIGAYETAGITPSSISTLYESRDSTLWIGTYYAGLQCLKNGKLTVFDLKHGFYDTEVRNIFQSRKGNIWIGTSGGLFRYRDGSIIPVFRNPNYVTGIIEDANGRIWVGTQDGIRIIDDENTAKISALGTGDGLPRGLTLSLFADRDSNIWIGTYDGLARWHNGAISVYGTSDGLAANTVTVITQDSKGNLWVGTPRGLCRRSGNAWSRFSTDEGLSDNEVLTITEDREGTLWVGTTNGLDQFRDVSFTTYTTYDGLPNDNLSGVHQSTDGSIYFFSNRGEVIARRLPSGKYQNYHTYVGPTYCARDGSIWMGQSGFLLNIRKGRIVRYDSTSGIPNKWISAITGDRQGLLFYSDHQGIFRFTHGRASPYRTKKGSEHPAAEYVVCLYQQKDSILWIGTSDWLAKIENGVYTKYTTDDGLAGNWTSSITDDHQGNIWISSPKGGLSRYRNGRFTAYSAKNGLFTDEIYCVLDDDAGNLWMGSPRGIGRVRIADLDSCDSSTEKKFTTHVYTLADGMKSDECFGNWQQAGSRSHDGSLWFATKLGAVHIVPSNFRKNILPPPVLIQQTGVDGRSYGSDTPGIFPPGSDKLEVHYTALSLIVPEKVRFKYALEGYDKGWVDAGPRRIAYYTNLPPGSYRFRVKACNNDGLWNETGALYSFTIEPRFYQTAWFLALIVGAAGVIVYGLIRLRMRQMIKRERELQNKIQEALAKIKTLSGLIPICANCKKIRDDQGYWDQLDEYVQSHSSVTFSHSICPDCAEKLYPGILTHQHKPKDKNPPTST